jgi:hypothetical protein
MRVCLPEPRIRHPPNSKNGINITSQAHDLCSDGSALFNDLISSCIGELRRSGIRVVGHACFHVLGQGVSEPLARLLGMLESYRLSYEDGQGTSLAEDSCTINFGNHAIKL